MATSPSFMSYLQNTSGVTSTTKKNPYGTTGSATTPTAGNSPVTPSGTVNPAPVPKATQPAQQPTQAQPTTPDPFAAMGGGVFVNGGWVPKNHPAAAQAQPQQGAGGGTGATVPGLPAPGYMQHLAGTQAYAGTNLGQHQNITYDPMQMQVNLPNMYGPYQSYTPQTQLPTQGYQAGNFGNTPFSQYQGNPGNITQFQGPNQQGIQNQQEALLQQMLNNPYSMSAENVAQLKGQQRATALALQKAGMGQNADQAAAMGRVGGSSQMAGDARLQDQANSNILSGYRDIDLQKMTQDRTDLLKALESATGVMDSASNRATSQYAQTLAGQQAREKVGLDAATSAQAAERLGLERTQAQELANFNQAKSAQDLASLGLTMDKLKQGENQFAYGTEQQAYKDQLAALGLEMDATKFNAGENWNATQSAQTNQQQALQRALGQAADSQAAAESGMKLSGMLQDAWNNQANRDTQTSLANTGFGIDREKIAQTGQIAKMDNSTRLLDILLGNQYKNAALGQSADQFNKSFGLQSQDQQNKLMQWLFGNI